MRKTTDGPFKRSRSAVRSAVIDNGQRASEGFARRDQALVLAAYARWAPIYDFVFSKLLFFGSFFDRGRQLAIDHMNTRQGKVLEVGVGTGVALNRYAPHLAITGIDLSPEMLAVARRRVIREHLSNVRALREMDAADLAFESASFETVAVMYAITVVPQPDLVLDEIARVLKPGGEAIFVSHFAANHGWRGRIEQLLVPVTRRLGWRPDVSIARLLNHPEFEHVETRRLPPLGVFSIVRLVKRVS